MKKQAGLRIPKLSMKRLRKDAEKIKVVPTVAGKSAKDSPFVKAKMEKATAYLLRSELPEIVVRSIEKARQNRNLGK